MSAAPLAALLPMLMLPVFVQVAPLWTVTRALLPAMLPLDRVTPLVNWPLAALLKVTLALPPFCPQMQFDAVAIAKEPLPSTESVPGVPLDATLMAPAVESEPPELRFTCELLTIGRLAVPGNSQLEFAPVTL